MFKNFITIEFNITLQNSLLLIRKSRVRTVEYEDKSAYILSFSGKAYKAFKILEVNILIWIPSSWDVNQLNSFCYSLVKIIKNVALKISSANMPISFELLRQQNSKHFQYTWFSLHILQQAQKQSLLDLWMITENLWILEILMSWMIRCSCLTSQ